ncbi:MATE family efflux transporter [Herbinix luporum]|jgi:putative MATE family efflux protein|uniref:Probable multidrug resistance protein NorM n=1 Tax=Herbinix luporum TaxID=1679721 RepID=A0A0K8J6X8_9FIRM|nr:MATE family efflux transporter [Herbinix luporum]CUH93260.1 putative membrane protein [Herbinix luporum]HHT57808.1 MATE family efflux transporter [Herbinix luporum]
MFTNKDLLKLIIPLIIEQILAVTVGMADGIMVARVGEAAVSGVSIVDSINFLLIGLFSAIATGGAVVSSQFLGQKKEKNASLAGEQLIVSNLALSIIIMIVTLAGRNMILSFLFGKVEADVMRNARIYFFYSALSYPFIAVYNACAALFRSMGNSKISMIVSIIANVINVAGNAILIFGFKMGVAGAAIPTLVSRIFSAVVMFILLMNKDMPIHIVNILKYRPNMVMIKRILRIGIPNGMENSVFQIGKILVQGIVAGLGTSAITANSIASNIGGFGVLPGSAVGLALITVVGQCVGAGYYDGVKLYTKKLMKITHLVMAGLNILIIFLIPVILKLYKVSDVTADIASTLMLYHCILSTFFWPPSFSLPNALRAASDVKFTMWVSMFSMWMWRIGFSYILAIVFDMGVLGVWIAMTIDWVFRSACFIYRFKKEKYRKFTSI